VSFFDAASDQQLGTIEVLAEPHELCFDPTQRLLWCATTYHSGYYHANSGARSELTVIDPDTCSIVDVIDLAPEVAPHGLSLDAERGPLYVSVEAGADRGGGVVIVDTRTRRAIGRIDTGAPGPHWFVASPDGTTGYASNKEAPFLSRTEPTGIRVIDTQARSVVAVLPTDNIVVPTHLTADGKVLTGEIRMAPAGGAPESGRREPWTLQAPGLLTVFSAHSHERLGSVEVGRCPLTITSSTDGSLGYVASVIDSTVDVIDLSSMNRLARLDVKRLGEPGAHGLAYIPRAG
jgi:DNA-binding beta-propeller fold protein YncE